MKKLRVLTAAAIAIFVLAGAVLATAAWFKLFKDTYKPAAGSALANAKCGVCHTGKVGKSKADLNAYGKMLKGKPVTVQSLKAIQNKDADKDGATNIAEIKAGKLPGDKTSKP